LLRTEAKIILQALIINQYFDTEDEYVDSCWCFFTVILCSQSISMAISGAINNIVTQGRNRKKEGKKICSLAEF
jgi:hypothetical protein